MTVSMSKRFILPYGPSQPRERKKQPRDTQNGATMCCAFVGVALFFFFLKYLCMFLGKFAVGKGYATWSQG